MPGPVLRQGDFGTILNCFEPLFFSFGDGRNNVYITVL